jgi:hypothetical protein
VPLDCKRQIIGGHANPVIRHNHALHPAPIERDVQPPGAGVYGIFYQFFYGSGGAFDHLARSNAVDNNFGQPPHMRAIRHSPQHGSLFWLV